MPACCSLKSPPSDMCHSLLLFSLITSPEMEKFYYGACLVCHSQMPRLQVAFGGGFSGNFFFSLLLDFSIFLFFSFRDSVTVFARVLQHPSVPPPRPAAAVPLLLKKKAVFSSKVEKKRGKKRTRELRGGGVTNLTHFVIGIYCLPLVH